MKMMGFREIPKLDGLPSVLSERVRTMAVMFGHGLPQVSLAAMATKASVTPTSVVMLVALLVFLRSFYYRYIHPLSKVPGMDSLCRGSGEDTTLSCQQVRFWPRSLVCGMLARVMTWR